MNPIKSTFKFYFHYSIGILFVFNLLTCVYGHKELEACISKLHRNISNCLELESFQLWPKDDKCKKYTVKIFPENTFQQPTAMTAFPPLVLPWLVKMIERSTGVIVGSMSAWFQKHDMESRTRCNVKGWVGKTMLQSHPDVSDKMFPKWFKKMISYDDEEFCWGTLSKFLFNYRGILVVRNPWHGLINWREYIRNELRGCSSCTRTSKTLSVAYDFEHEHFKKYFEFGAKQWVHHVKSWVKGSPHGSNMVIIKYEELFKDPGLQLRRIFNYLNLTVEQDRLDCVLNDPSNIHESISENNLRVTLSSFFEKNLDSKSNYILKAGIHEINELFRLKGIQQHLDYKRPTHSEFLTRNDMFITNM